MTTNRKETPAVFTTIPIDDFIPLSVAELLLRKERLNISIQYAPNWSGRIVGTITGDVHDMRRVFQALENNDPLPCRDLAEAIKLTRSKIFQEKQRNSESLKWSGKGPR